MRVAVYGGSFNPPHVVHGMVASWLLWTGRADAVWLVPVYHHAFEGQQDKRLAPFDVRVGWCEALARDVDPGGRIQVCTVEAELPVPSFTIDTLRHLARTHGDHDFRLVVGADVLPQLPRWRDWAGIQAAFAPVVVGRDGHPAPPDSVVFPGVSSSDIRARLARGAPVDHLLTASVAAAVGQGEDLVGPVSPGPGPRTS